MYERYNFRLFSPLMALAAIIFLVYTQYVGTIICLALGILLSFSYQGIIIDRDQNQYLRYDRFVSFRIGQWMPLSAPLYVTVVRINLSSQRTVPSPLVLPENTKRAKAYKVNLVVDGDERYVFICRGSLEEMTEEALKLGKTLGIRVLDYTTHEKKWIL
jgi:hypothetical protein